MTDLFDKLVYGFTRDSNQFDLLESILMTMFVIGAAFGTTMSIIGFW